MPMPVNRTERTGSTFEMDQDACVQRCGNQESQTDAAAELWRGWRVSTNIGAALWSRWIGGDYRPSLKAEMDEASDRAFEIEDRLAATPASTLAGVAGKLRIFAHYCAEQGGEPAPDERLALSALADIERMIREKR
jgi:hypothetical protein